MPDRLLSQGSVILTIGLILIAAVLVVPVSALELTSALVHRSEGDSSETVTQRFSSPSTKGLRSLVASPNAVYLVTSSADLPDDSLEDGIFFPQTLRSAIENANLSPSVDVIMFEPSVTEIAPATALPTIDAPILIDGITLDGSNIVPQVGVGQYGLTFRAGAAGSIVDSIEVRNFPDAGIFIGTRDMIVRGCTIHSNQGPGILGNAARLCEIGGINMDTEGNRIYDNFSSSGNGIQLFTDIFGNTSDSNLIHGNYIGTPDGIGTASNLREGVAIWGNYNRVSNNLISGNEYDGIKLGQDIDNPSTANFIDSNLIGVTIGVFGLVPLPNGLGNSGEGISIRYSQSDTILANFIGSNYGHGIEFTNSGNHAYIANNVIGVDTTWSQPLGNDGNGMLLRGDFNLLEHNHVGGNVTGVSIQGNSNTVRANVFGSDISPVLGNTVSGVQIGGNNNLLGGPDFADANICSGNNLYGITVAGRGSTNNLVQGNYVGAKGPLGALPPNLRDGIRVVDSVQGTRIFDNTIVGNDSNGVQIQATYGRRPRGTLLERNIIGDFLGVSEGNGRSGVFINGAVGTMIGGLFAFDGNGIEGNGLHGVEIRNGDSTTVVANTISENFGSGIVIDTGLYNRIFENSVYDNGLLGIDLGGDGITGNDTDDLDDGPNMLQNYPFIAAVTSVNDTLIVVGELDGAPLTDYVIDMYRNSFCDPSGNGEGQVWMHSEPVTSGVNGIALLDFKVASVYDPTFINLTFTATDADGNTSEFTPCFELLLLTADVELSKEASSDTVTIGDTLTFVMTVDNNGPDIATGTTVIDSLPAGVTYVSDSSTQGTCTFADDVLTCLVGTMAPGADATITLKVVADSVALLSNTALAAAAESDPLPQNNSNVAMVEVEDHPTGVSTVGPGLLPTEFFLAQNYPNPFNPTTTIEFSLARRSQVELQIFNLSGQRIRDLLATDLPAGNYSIVWDSRSETGELVASGVYFYRLVAGDFVSARKMILLK